MWVIVGQGPTVLAVGAGGFCLGIFFSSPPSYLFFLPLRGRHLNTEILLKQLLNPEHPSVHMRWTDEMQFDVLLNSISVISGRWEDDDEKLCAMEPRLRLRRFCLEQGWNPGPLDQKAST